MSYETCKHGVIVCLNLCRIIKVNKTAVVQFSENTQPDLKVISPIFSSSFSGCQWLAALGWNRTKPVNPHYHNRLHWLTCQKQTDPHQPCRVWSAAQLCDSLLMTTHTQRERNTTSKDIENPSLWRSMLTRWNMASLVGRPCRLDLAKMIAASWTASMLLLCTKDWRPLQWHVFPDKHISHYQIRQNGSTQNDS